MRSLYLYRPHEQTIIHPAFEVRLALEGSVILPIGLVQFDTEELPRLPI